MIRNYRSVKNVAAVLGCACLLTLTVRAVESPTRAVESGKSEKVSGTIQGRDGETLRVKEDTNSVVVVDLTQDTKVQMKQGFLHGKKGMEVTALVPGLRITAEGKGNDQGQLVASKVTFDQTSYKASRSIDTRVSPLESRAGQLENRAGALEGRAGQLESKATQLEAKTGELANQQQQTQQQVTQVKGEAEQANQGVTNVNNRVNTLDDYDQKLAATVYFKTGSARLSDEAKKDLDDLVQKTKELKGYVVEVAGFTDTTGKRAFNEELSDRRANAVVRYLEENDVPLRRILTPAGLADSHSVADNKTKDGRKMNRRVEVKVFVNKALEGGTSAMNTPQQAPQAQAPAQAQ
jgi:outer membrane protein OmpA-like peptidoglycan-associated protein